MNEYFHVPFHFLIWFQSNWSYTSHKLIKLRTTVCVACKRDVERLSTTANKCVNCVRLIKDKRCVNCEQKSEPLAEFKCISCSNYADELKPNQQTHMQQFSNRSEKTKMNKVTKLPKLVKLNYTQTNQLCKCGNNMYLYAFVNKQLITVNSG